MGGKKGNLKSSNWARIPIEDSGQEVHAAVVGGVKLSDLSNQERSGL